MTKAEIKRRVEELKPWYHSIGLPHGVTTPGLFEAANWTMIREVRQRLDYHGRLVLDLATFDGMWAFEAEELGAELVIATDCNWRAIEKFLFAREARGSRVVGFHNVPSHELVRRLDAFLVGNDVRWRAEDHHPKWDRPRFDIVQHLGLLYHLRDPMLSLLQARSIMRKGGMLLLETAYLEGDASVMEFNIERGQKTRRYGDYTTWWMPTVTCLKDMLWASLFEPVGEVATVKSRCCLVATAIDDAHPVLLRELRNTYRTPGLESP